ncbi:MAG TPA: hypothetical protein VFQ44_30520 [Streptosporangiaceae bacterium]|nr:hypothetical protein [Streptosporangiaceae bacterium]
MGKVPGFQFAAPGALAADLSWVFIQRSAHLTALGVDRRWPALTLARANGPH